MSRPALLEISLEVDQHGLDGHYIQTFDSVHSAAEEIGVQVKVIESAIYSDKAAGGYQWSWHDERGDEDGRKRFHELYQKKVLDIIFKKNARNPGFLGGLAVPLLKEDFSTALGRVSEREAIDGNTPDDLWNYEISPKVDGERFLMFLGSDSMKMDTKNDTLLNVYFIDRYNKPYILQKGSQRKRIPTVRKIYRTQRVTEQLWSGQNMIPPCLIDGELLAVDTDGNLINPRFAEADDIDQFYFVAFDILLGPDRPRKGDEDIWEYGANVAMCGPKVGGLHGRSWTFKQRSNVLRKILDPEGPYIQTYARVCPWFKTLYKPHYSVSEFKKISGASVRSLKIGLPSGTEFDGVIFTPKWGKYMISRGKAAWIAPNNTVYKWKPVPTVDLLFEKEGDRIILYCGSGRKRRSVSRDNVMLGHNRIRNGGIGEFRFFNDSWYLIKDRSLERDKPNGCETFEKTMDAIENPIRDEDFEVGIRYYNSGRVSTREYLDTVMTVQDLVKLVVFGGKMSLFSILDISIDEKLALGVDAVRLAPGKITEDLYHLLLQKMFWGGYPTEFPPEYIAMGELAGLPPPGPRPMMMKRNTPRGGSKTTTFWFDGDVLLYARTVEWDRKRGERTIDLGELYKINQIAWRRDEYLDFVIRSGNVVETTSKFTPGGNVDVETKIRFIINNDWYLDLSEVRPANDLEKDPDFRLTLFPRVEIPRSETLSQAVGIVFSILSLR